MTAATRERAIQVVVGANERESGIGVEILACEIGQP